MAGLAEGKKTKEELYDFLITNGIDEEDAELLKNEGVDEVAAEDITEKDLAELTIKLGPRKKIIKLLKSLTPSVVVTPPPIYEELPEKPSVDPVPSSSRHEEINSAYLLPNVNMRTILQSSSNGLSLLKKINTNDIGRREIEALGRIFVDDLRKRVKYPSAVQQENLARCIVASFPKLGQTDNPDDDPWSKWYNPKGSRDGRRPTGIIALRIGNTYNDIPPDCRKNVLRKHKLAADDCTKTNLKKQALDASFLEPSEENLDTIFNSMKLTFNYRQLMKETLNTHDFIIMFPHLLHFNGRLIYQDFAQSGIYKGALAELWKFFQVSEDNFDSQDQLNGILNLILLLPTPQSKNLPKLQKKDFKESVFAGLISWKKTEEMIRDTLANWADSLNADTKIIILGEFPNVGEKIFLQVKNKSIELRGNFFNVFDLWFKSHYVFNLKAYKPLASLINFLDVYVYKKNKVKPFKVVTTMKNVFKNDIVLNRLRHKHNNEDFNVNDHFNDPEEVINAPVSDE